MKYLMLLAICLMTVSISAQDATTYKKTTKAFLENFNTQNIDAIFELYTKEMQEEITKEGVARFVNSCYEQFGNLKSLTFIETTENVNSYTATFDKIDLAMELQLDKDGKISTIQFQEP